MFSRSEKVLLLLLGCINFTHIIDFMIVMPLGPQLTRIFNLDPHQFGLLISCYAFAAGTSGLIVASIIDRFDRKAALLFLYSGFAIGTIACAISRDYTWLLISRTVSGFFGGVLASVVMSIVSDAISPERRGAAMGTIMSSFSVASIVGVPFSLYLANKFDWHAPFMFLGVLSLFISLLVALTLPKMAGHLRGPHHEHVLQGFQQIAKSSSQRFAMVFMFCLTFGQFLIIPYLSPSFVFNGKMPESDLPLIYLTGGLVSMFASPIFGRLADRYGKRKMFYFGALGSILPMMVITQMGPNSVVYILSISCLFFLVMSGRMVPAMALISMATTPRYRASFMSVNSSVQQMAMGISSYLSGLIIIQTPTKELLGYGTVGYMAAIFTILSVSLVGKIQPVEAGAKA